jgi:hypothetical protein
MVWREHSPVPPRGDRLSIVWPRDTADFSSKPSAKGILTAIEGGVNWYPIAAFDPKSKGSGWEYPTGGMPAVAVLAEDINGDGVPDVFLGRQDGFVNVLALAGGRELGLLNTGEPILGMAMLEGANGKPCLAVGTKFAVHLFGADLRPLGRQPLASVAFAGPSGEDRDGVYAVGADGKVTLLVLAGVSAPR